MDSIGFKNRLYFTPMIRYLILLFAVIIVCMGCGPKSSQKGSASDSTMLHIMHDTATQTFSVFRAGEKTPILTQNARENFRPYVHPIIAPDGKGVLTEY